MKLTDLDNDSNKTATYPEMARKSQKFDKTPIGMGLLFQIRDSCVSCAVLTCFDIDIQIEWYQLISSIIPHYHLLIINKITHGNDIAGIRKSLTELEMCFFESDKMWKAAQKPTTIPSGKCLQKTMENQDFSWEESSLFLWPCSIAKSNTLSEGSFFFNTAHVNNVSHTRTMVLVYLLTITPCRNGPVF